MTRRFLVVGGILLTIGGLIALARPTRRGCNIGRQRLVFADDVRAGHQLTFDDVQPRTFPTDDPDPGGVSPYAPAEFIGLELLAPHAAGEVIRLEHFRSPRFDPARGLRTVRLEGDGFPRLERGDHVDLHLATNEVARIVLHAARVIDALPGKVWLELTPEEADGLALARRAGSVALSRRAPEDCEGEDTGVAHVVEPARKDCDNSAAFSLLGPAR